jgi:hypothetical protein
LLLVALTATLTPTPITLNMQLFHPSSEVLQLEYTTNLCLDGLMVHAQHVTGEVFGFECVRAALGKPCISASR